MPSISQLVSEREEAVVTVKGVDITVTYSPSRLTLGAMTEIQRKAADESSSIEAAAFIIEGVADAWDIEGPIVGNDGEELVGVGEVAPVSREVILALPAFFAIELSNQLQELVTDGPNPTRAKARSRKR